MSSFWRNWTRKKSSPFYFLHQQGGSREACKKENQTVPFIFFAESRVPSKPVGLSGIGLRRPNELQNQFNATDDYQDKNQSPQEDQATQR